MNGTDKINHIDFSRIRDFVLTPGALLYATMTRRGLARSINDVSRKIYEAHGIEESVIVDFLFDRIPLNNELAVAIAPFFFWQPVENI